MKWFILVILSAGCVAQKELKLVHVVSRHGERTPLDFYKNDIYSKSTFYPFGVGQLTNIGKKSQYATGEFLRQRYHKFLGNVYSPDIVYAQSTGSDRAFMSCSLILAGMWPAKNTLHEWNSHINWSPIRIKSEPWNDDTLLMVSKPCPRYEKHLKEVNNLPHIKSLMKRNDKLLKQLTNFTGNAIETPNDVYLLYSTLLAEDTYGLKLPQWTKKIYPNKLTSLVAENFILSVYNGLMKRLKGGPLLKKIISDWSSKAEETIDPEERKLFVYSGHDSTVANLLHTLGVWEKQVPGYGIMTIFELYQDIKTKEYGVEVYLRNSTTDLPYQLTIPGCGRHCPLSQLIELTWDMIPINWEEECVLD